MSSSTQYGYGLFGNSSLYLDNYEFDRLGGFRYSRAPINAEWNWTVEARRVGNYLARFYATDPLLRAFVAVRAGLTLGARGLRFKSRWQRNADSEFDAEERRIQRLIDQVVTATYDGTQVDMGDALTRVEVEEALIVSKIIGTDGFAVKVVLDPDSSALRPGDFRTKWRIVNPNRVMNPANVDNWCRPEANGVARSDVPSDSIIWEGIEIGEDDHRPRAIWINVEPPSKGQGGYWSVGENDKFVRAEYYDDLGNQQVIHDFDPLQPGQLRGYPSASPFLFTLLQLQGVTEAHVVNKRVQASNPMFIKGVDTKIAAEFEKAKAVIGPNTRQRPGGVTYIGEDADMVFPSMSFDGSDYQEFMEAHVRNMSAAWNLPWQYVLAHVSGVSMASGRIYVDRAQKTGERWQNDHIAKITKVIDQSYILEGIKRGTLPISSVRRGSDGIYLRPRAASLDPNKDVAAMRDMIAGGVAPSEAYANKLGLDFEEQMVIGQRDREFAESRGYTVPTEPVEPEQDEPEDDEGGNDADDIAQAAAELEPMFIRDEESGRVEIAFPPDQE